MSRFEMNLEEVTITRAGEFAKHESHDQSTHGSWADGGGGAEAGDIRSELATYFGTDTVSYLASEGYKSVIERTNTSSDERLDIIAEKQGFDGVPTVVSATDLNKLSREDYEIAYRGIAEGTYPIGIGAVPSSTYFEQFKSGKYHSGLGQAGNGIYFADNYRVAKSYAGERGTVMRVGIPKNKMMSSDKFHEAILQNKADMDANKFSFYGAEDVGRNLASQGVRAVRTHFNLGNYNDGATLEKVYIVYDRSMLRVQDVPATD